jgi:predicted transcriptional regulator
MEKTKREIRTVERTITLKIPERFDKELEILANALKRTVESILKNELYATLENWYSGGFAEGWEQQLYCFFEEGKKLQEEVTEVANAEGC